MESTIYVLDSLLFLPALWVQVVQLLVLNIRRRVESTYNTYSTYVLFKYLLRLGLRGSKKVGSSGFLLKLESRSDSESKYR